MRELDKEYVNLYKIDCRGFIISPNYNDVIIKYDKDSYIESIFINDRYKISVGDVFEIDSTKYTINIIQKLKDKFYCIEEKLTKTSQFILPILGNTYTYYDFENSFYNSYISEDYSFLYIVFKFNNNATYLDLESRLLGHADFKQIFDPNPNLVVVKFNISKVFLKDIQYILEGKYNKISDILKVKIIRFHKYNQYNKTWRMFNKDADLRLEMEKELDCTIPKNIDLISKPIKEEEIWTFHDILKKDGILS